MQVDDNKIIDGLKISKLVIDEVKAEVQSTGLKPGLALILVGKDPASEIYVKMKAKRCAETGFYSVTDRLPSDTNEDELLKRIDAYNKDPKIHGILVQLPLPSHINELKILESVDHRKDVDGFHPINSGRLVIGERCFVPATPAGIMELLKRYGVIASGMNAVVLGRSNIVGKPIANLLVQKNRYANASVTVCHSSTKDITEYTKTADLIVAAIGRPKFLKADMIKEGAVIVDVGINRIEDASESKGYRIEGDVDFDGCYQKASMITPVPGGVGPMTIAMLLRNTMDAAANKVYS